jgi:uncharacterized protein YbjQ (UPF0145 family)
MPVTTTFTIEGYRISEVASNMWATEVICYGTAVVIEKA